MKFQGESFFQAPRDRVWAAIVDPRAALAKLSGFQRLDAIGDHEYEGAFSVSVGDVRGDFQGTLELADLKPPSSLRFSLNAMGAAGFVDGDGLMVLEEATGGTRIHYDLDAKVGGRIAGVGEDALEEWAKTLAQSALDGLRRRSGAAPPPARFKVVTKQEVPSPVEQVPVGQAEAAVPPAVAVPGEGSVIPAGPQPESKPPDPEIEAAPGPGLTTPELGATSAPARAPVESASAPSGASEAGPMPPRQGQYGSRVSQDFADRFKAVVRRPEVMGVALILYTIFVILMTRSCS